MADMIKATTPITNKNITQPIREKSSEASPFNIQDLNKVVKTNPESEMQQQNNGNIDKDTAPQIMMELLKDPAVTVNFIKNIIMLQEITGIISSQNNTVTEEIKQLFEQLSINPENISEELLQQEYSSTAFKGKLFDFLRNIIQENESPEAKKAVINMLKAINTEKARPEIFRALSNSISFLSDTLAPSDELSSRLKVLSDKFNEDDAEKNFPQLRGETSDILKDIERSILFSDKLSRLTSMVKYNLSRYNDSTVYLGNSAKELMMFIHGENNKTEFLQKLYECLSDSNFSEIGKSKVLDILVKILEKQTESPELMRMKGDNIENVIHSLLSSPSNFTPLLHFIIPMETEDGSKSFGEMWINPDEEETSNLNEKAEKIIHMLLVFDIPDTGRFETELYVKGKKIDVSLRCPPNMELHTESLASELKKCIDFSEYSFNDIKLSKLEHARSLIEVFPSLPKKRVGINVKI